MTSKSLFFKLLKSDWKRRLWALVLIAGTLFFALPVMASILEPYDDAQRTLVRQMTNLLSKSNIFLTFIMIISAAVLGVSGFSYLHSSKMVDFYHSLPIKRWKLFFIQYINGILLFAIPFVINMVIGAGIAQARTGGVSNLIATSLVTVVSYLLYFTLLYSTTVLAMVLTGNRLVAILGVGVLNCFAVFAVWLGESYVNNWYYAYDLSLRTQSASLLQDVANFFSPLFLIVSEISNTDTNFGAILPTLIIILLEIALITAFSCLLYTKRQSEAAGKAMAFSISRPIIQIPLVILCSCTTGMIFWGARSQTFWTVFGVICGAVISHCVIEVIYHFDFKKLLSQKLQMIACLAVSIAIFCTFRYDLLGYDSYLPTADQVESAAVYLGLNNMDWPDYGKMEERKDSSPYYAGEWGGNYTYLSEHMMLTELEPVLNLAKAGIAIKKQMRGNERNYHEELYRGRGETRQINIKYRLKNGRTVYRSYEVVYRESMEDMKAIFDSREYKEGLYPVMNQTAEEIVQVSYKQMNDERILSIPTAQDMENLLSVYQKEFGNLNASLLEKEMPVGLIRFTTAERQKDYDLMNMEGDYKHNYRYDKDEIAARDYYPIYTSFTETLAQLKALGAGTRDTFEIDQVVSVSSYNNSGEEVTIQNPDEIRIILENSFFEEYSDRNSFYSYTYNRRLEVNTVSEDGLHFYRFAVNTKKLPDEIRYKLWPELEEEEDTFQSQY